MKLKNISLILTLLVLFSESHAMADMEIPWANCVKEAKKSHPDLVSAAEKIGQAKATKEITRSATLPQLTGNANETTSQGPSGNIQIEQTGSSTQGFVGGGPKGSTTDYSFGANAQQLLFDGFKTSYQLSSDQRNIYASRYNYDVTSSNIRLRLRIAYANLLASQELLKVTEGIEKRRKDTLDLVKMRYEGGREHRGSLLTSEADLAQAVYDVKQAKRGIYMAQRQLVKELGWSRYTPLTAVGDFEVNDSDPDRPDFERLAETTPLLQQLMAQKEAAKFGLRSAKAQFYPTVYASGNASNSNTDAFPDQNAWSIGTTVTLPIFDGGNTIATVQKAKAALGQSEADERSGRDGVIVTLSNAWTVLQNAIDLVVVQRKFLMATEERAKISKAEYAIGLLIYDNWIIIENNLVSAKKNYLNAELAALIAEANWIQAKGGTLDYDKE
jgi:outer membrane protein TolC